MVLALFFMLVALMVSHTILSAAASAARSTLTQTDRQQAFLTVNSAAQTLKASVKDMDPYEKSVLHTFTDNTFRAEYGDPKTTKKTKLEGPFSYELQTLIEEYSIHADAVVPKAYLILVDGYEPVAVKLRLKKISGETSGLESKDLCRLDAEFTNLLPTELSGKVSGYTQPKSPTRITLTMNGTFRRTITSTDEQKYTKTVTETMTWDTDNAVFQKKLPEEEQP